MGTQVVQDHYVPLTQRRHQRLIHIIRLKCRGLGGPREHQGGCTPSSSSAAITVSVAHDVGTELTARLPRDAQASAQVIVVVIPVSSMKINRLGARRRTFPRNERRFSWTSVRSRSRACRVFFLRVRFRRRKACHRVFTLQGKPPRCFRLLQSGVGLLVNQPCEALSLVRPQGGRWAAPMRLGGLRTGIATSLEQADDERGADPKPPGNLTKRALAVIHRRRDWLAKVARIRTHGSLLSLRYIPPPLELFPCATRR